MNEQPVMQVTDFDSLTSDRHLQMMKAALPYIAVPEQKFLSILVKCQELRHTVELFENEETASMGICSLDEEAPRSSLDMLMAVKPYGNDQEQDFIEMLCSLIQGIRLGSQYQEMQEKKERTSKPPAAETFRRPSLDQLRNFLPPEMQTRMDTASMLMQAMQQMT